MVPLWIQKALAPVLARLPDTVISRVLPRSRSFSSGSLEPLPASPSGSTRLYVAPANFAGQGWQWARAVERNLPGIGAMSMSVGGATGFGYPTDYQVPIAEYTWSHKWSSRQEAWVTRNFTHVLIEAERAIFSGGHRASVRRDVKRLSTAGVDVAMVCHGSDIRLPSRHAALNWDSPFRDPDSEETRVLEKLARGNIALLEGLGRPVFVSTPDLLVDVPSATWLPVVIEPEVWGSPVKIFQADRIPVVAHAPSRAALKGSDLVDPLLRRLEVEGLLRYLRVEGISAEYMPEVYRSADIVLDQFRLGSYGVAACEAMAAGRLVISHVSDAVRNHVATHTGLELPIVEASGATLESVIRQAIAEPSTYAGIAARGPEFVREVHDGCGSAKALSGFLGTRG